ncbi:hypothetical protein T4A_13615 [Trichinella pseudospiralis]|uniref:Uncharacterized protein n=1 Tax=Trichinella pseudospiralis TaxID=6337 RepID=A0A0V1IPS3_TRIPS|nr:hypothetical protein T4A_13615 [Trichinella pseudospiralis]KRZ24712.1 hypothetical protein T4C_4855 [Trichinella pseudospiralis]
MYLMKEFCRHNIIPLNATSIVKKQLQTAKIEEEQHQEVMIQQCPYRTNDIKNNLLEQRPELGTGHIIYPYHKTVYDNLKYTKFVNGTGSNKINEQ